MKRLLLLFFFVLCCISFFRANSLVVGSNTILTRQGPTSFPSVDTDNKILGFTMMEQGFTLQDNTTTCTYDAFFPVSGSIILNGGTFYLNQDLVLDNVATFTSFGNIIGTNHLLRMSSFMSTLGSSDQGLLNLNNVELQLNNDIQFNGNFLFSGGSVLDGKGYVLDMSPTASLVVAPGSQLLLKNIRINNVHGQNISCQDDNSSVILNNVFGVFDQDFSFTKGSILIDNLAYMEGAFTFSYESSQTSTINGDSVLHFDQGATLYTGRYVPNPPVEPLAFVDQTSILELENCRLIVNPNGMRFSKGKMRFIRDVTIDVLSTSTNNGIFLGAGSTNNDVVFDLEPGCTLIFNPGHIFFDVINQNVIRSQSTSSQIIRNDGSYFYMNRNSQSKNVTLQTANNALTVIRPGVTLTYTNLTLVTSFGSFNVTGSQSQFGIVNLSGSNSATAITGAIPFALLVSGTSNTLSGNGSFGQVITMLNSATQVTWGVNGFLLANITMNSGTLILTSDLKMAATVLLSGTGTVVLNSNSMILGNAPLTWNSATTFTGSQGTVKLTADVALTNSWIFSGTAIIDGQSNVLDLTSGSITVTSGSSLTLKNIVLKGISGTNITCADNTSTIILDGVYWNQTGNYSFANGNLRFKNNVRMIGAYLFAYRSAQASTILARSNLYFDTNFTYSYDPIQNSSPNLFVFTDQTSTLNLTRSTLHATLPGLNLTKGMLFVRGNSVIESETITNDLLTTDNGVTIGDGILADDCICNITPGAQLQVNFGSLNYRNVDSFSWVMESTNSILFMNVATTLRLYMSLNLGSGLAQFENDTLLARAQGAQIFGSIIPLGTLNYGSL